MLLNASLGQKVSNRTSLFGKAVVTAVPSARNTARGSRLLVEAGKGERIRIGNAGARPTGPPTPPTPPVDPDNEEFIVFVRSKKLPSWAPLTLFKGGGAANLLVKQFNEGTNQLVKDTLTRNIGESLYKEKKELTKLVLRMYPTLKFAKEIEFGFKIRDKTKPERWYVPEKVFVIPAEGQLPQAPLQNVGDKVKDAISSFGTLVGIGGKKEEGDKVAQPAAEKKGF